MLPFSEPRVVFPFRSMASPASMLTPSPAFRLPEVRYWAAVASWLTLLRTTSLSVRPLAVTLSAYLPLGSTTRALLKNEGEDRFVEDI